MDSVRRYINSLRRRTGASVDHSIGTELQFPAGRMMLLDFAKGLFTSGGARSKEQRARYHKLAAIATSAAVTTWFEMP